MTERSRRMIGQKRCPIAAQATGHSHGYWRAVASLLFICLVSMVLGPGSATAQDVEVKAVAQPAAVAPAPSGQPMPMPGAQPMPMPGGAQPMPMPGAADPNAPMPMPMPTTRPAAPSTPPDPEELKVQPDEDGTVSFSFKGQSWPAVLEWLADVSEMSLEWQETPAGYLDLTTRGRYTVDEARDMINSVLLSRGFTLLRNGEVLMCVDLKKLDISLVPRVTEEELDERGTYELVRVFFDLNRLRAETLVDELKPLLSPYGKISALKTTNRLDVMDSVGNLRRLRDLLHDEQAASGQNYQIREFKLQHIRADEAMETLQALLGVKSKGAGGPMTPEQMQAQQQAMMQQMQMRQQQQQQGGAPPGEPKTEPEIFLTVNLRENSIIANASPDKLAAIEEAITLLDVQQNRPQSALAQMPRVQIYRLTGIDPDPLVKVLKELGNLDPATRLQVDTKNRSIIANASLADHVTIRALVDKLDGSMRKFEVIQLRKLDAEYVAGSIEFLMRGAGKQEESSNRRRFFYYDSFNNDDQQKETDKFQVEADTENNRLLLRANDIELEEVRQLLIKLGEIGEDGSSLDTMRVIPLNGDAEQRRLLEKIRRLWPTVSPNPLETDADVPADDEAVPAAEDTQPTTRVRPATKPAIDKPTETEARRRPGARGAVLETSLAVVAEADAEAAPAEEPAESVTAENAASKEATAEEPAVEDATVEESAAEQPQPRRRVRIDREPAAAVMGPREAMDQKLPPVSISRGPQGLIITSQDPAAMDRLLELVDRLTPTRHSYHTFTLKHSFAEDVAELLEDIFKEDGDDDKDSRSNLFRSYYWGNEQESQDKGRNRLSKRRALKFVPDDVTNTILVQGADEQQLAEIKSLIEMYDRVEPPDSQSVRKTQMVKLKYASAPEIAESIKDVFRDLLSPNDKALAAAGQPQQQQQQERPRYSFYDLLSDLDSGDQESAPRFKGLLSVGVNKEANMMIISAPNYLLSDVVAMVRQLDEEAKPTRSVVRVLRAGKFVNDPSLKTALSNISDPNNKNGAAKPEPIVPGSVPGNGNANGNDNGQPRNPGQTTGQPAANAVVPGT